MRAIDGDELLGIERLLDTDVVRQSKAASWLLDQVLHDIQAMPALRPVSREQVEKVWRGEWVHDPETGYEHCDKCSHTISLDDYMNRKPPLFCEMCGAAMTDEAVEMVMERMEALYETT